jgi:hypothetical protein
LNEQNDIRANQEFDSYIRPYLASAPFILAAIAISFDVGSFYAVDINSFTFFSLSEHILFALEALPIAMVILLVIIVMLPAAQSRFQLKPRVQQPLKGFSKLIVIFCMVTVLIALTAFVLFAFYQIWKTSPVFVLAFIFFVLPVIGVFIIDPRFTQLYLILSAGFLCIAVSFSFGFAFSTGLLINSQQLTTLNLKNKPTLNGRIIRSGERGILFYERQVNVARFIPWETIETIETPVNPQ